MPDADVAGAALPEVAPALDEPTATRVGRDRVRRLKRIGRRARYVANKALDHDRLLGFAWQVMPGARVIAVERDPRDVGLSCFAAPLKPENQPWASNLAHIARAVVLHDVLMKHWRAVLDLPVLTVRYEALVQDQEHETRRMLEFLELPFDGACLRPHENDRTVLTLSADQVRQPVYTSSVGRWRTYEPWLGELLENLPGSE
jgi:hypothetical protein